MNSLVILGIMAIVIQFIIDRVKVILPERNRTVIVPLIALLVGVVLSATTGIALFAALGVTISPVWIDYIITGVAFSGGSVAFNELLKLIMELRPSSAEDGGDPY